VPKDKFICPGVIEPQSNYIEHPEVIAQRLARWAGSPPCGCRLRILGPRRNDHDRPGRRLRQTRVTRKRQRARRVTTLQVTLRYNEKGPPRLLGAGPSFDFERAVFSRCSLAGRADRSSHRR
jgi:hypothetical protein